MECVGSFVKKHKNGDVSYFKKYLVDGKNIFFHEIKCDEDDNVFYQSFRFLNMEVFVELDEYLAQYADYSSIVSSFSTVEELFKKNDVEIFSKADEIISMQKEKFSFIGVTDKEDCEWKSEIFSETEVDFETGDQKVKTDIYKQFSHKIQNGLCYQRFEGHRYDNSYSYLEYDEETNSQYWSSFSKEDAA